MGCNTSSAAKTTVNVPGDTVNVNVSPIVLEGITLAALDMFVSYCGSDALFNLTTEEVFARFIAPPTAAANYPSYCEILKQQNSNYAGQPTVFIIHSRGSLFLDMFAALKLKFNNEPSVVLWIDIFNSNQRQRTKDTTWLRAHLRQAIKRIGRCVLVLTSSGSSSPLMRTWCLYETYCAITTEAKLELAVSRNYCLNLVSNIVTHRDTFESMLPLIDMDSSVASVAADRVSILAALEDSHLPLDHFNRIVSNTLNELIVTATDEVIYTTDPADVEARLNQRDSLALLYTSQGKHTKAEAIYRENLEARRDKFGAEHTDTLATLSSLAGCLKQQGRYEEAEGLFKECLDVSKECLGLASPRTRRSITNVAKMYEIQGRFGEAEQMYKDCLESTKAALGEDHTETFVSMKDLASLYKSQGRYSEAEHLFQECLDGSITKQGKTHPLTLRAMSDLGGLYHAQGRYLEFEKIYNYCIETSEEEQGLQNEETLFYQETLSSHYESVGLTSLNNLARIFESQGRAEDAERILKAISHI